MGHRPLLHSSRRAGSVELAQRPYSATEEPAPQRPYGAVELRPYGAAEQRALAHRPYSAAEEYGASEEQWAQRPPAVAEYSYRQQIAGQIADGLSPVRGPELQFGTPAAVSTR